MADAPSTVRITWLDSQTIEYGQWIAPDEYGEALAPSGMTCETVGFVVAETQAAVLIAHSVNSDGSRAAGCIAIPTVAILERRETTDG